MVLFVITVACIVINAILAYLFHNSRYPNGKKLTLPVATWLIWAIIVLIPIVNGVLTIALIIHAALMYSDGDWIIQEESWLGKRY